jgi:hypothetical protein
MLTDEMKADGWKLGPPFYQDRLTVRRWWRFWKSYERCGRLKLHRERIICNAVMCPDGTAFDIIAYRPEPTP